MKNNNNEANKVIDGFTGGHYTQVNGITVISPAKPIIYLYPEKQLRLTLKLKYPEKITCSYPEYKEG